MLSDANEVYNDHIDLYDVFENYAKENVKDIVKENVKDNTEENAKENSKDNTKEATDDRKLEKARSAGQQW